METVEQGSVGKPGPTRSRVALIIGNAAYREPLLNPINDAREITGRLRAAGFHIVGGVGEDASLGRDTTADTLRTLVETFVSMIRKGTTAVVYYAGHGIQIGEQNYLVPVNARLGGDDPLLELVPLSSIVDRACERAGQSGRVVVLLDACRNNPFTGEQIEGVSRAVSLAAERAAALVATVPASAGSRGLARMRLAPPERIAPQFIAFATAPGEVAYDGEPGDGNSPFAAALARHIPTRGLAVSALIDRVGLDVEQRVSGMGLSQDPWCTTNLKEPMYIRPRTWLPLFEMAALGALAGLAICALLFNGGRFVNPYDPGSQWAWALGLLFSVPFGLETVRWGDPSRSRWAVLRDTGFVIAGSAIAFALGLITLRLIVHAQTIGLAPDGVRETGSASRAFFVLALAAGALMLLGTLLSWKPQRRTFNGIVTGIMLIAAPPALTACLLSFADLLMTPERSAAVLLALVAGILFAAGTAISCVPLGGLFRSFGPLTGAIVIGLSVALFFLWFDTLRLGGPAQTLLAGLGLGAAWFSLLAVQLGYCLVYYVPDHRGHTVRV